MTLRPCLGCRRPTEGNRCATCRSAKNRERDQLRGSSTARGYDHLHEAERARLAPTVAAGQAYCTEPICLEADRWIHPGTDWDLAHNRDAPGTYHGPAHSSCNRAEGARFAQASRKSSAQE